jgi:hypothetical protein
MRVRKNKIHVVLLVVVCLMMLLTGCGMKNLRETKVTGLVADKEYQPAYYTYITNTIWKEPSLQKVSHKAKYLVLITYNDLYVTVDNQELYESVSVDDEVEVILREWENNADETESDIVWR